MLKTSFILFLLLSFTALFAQETKTHTTRTKYAVTDIIKIDSISLQKSSLKILDSNDQLLAPTNYQVEQITGYITIDKTKILSDSITVLLTEYPEFLTKTYSIYENPQILDNAISGSKLYQIPQQNSKKFIPFDGLNTVGSISRGITIGNNQSAVVNSNLDLQITGKISEDVTLKASLQDSNIPLQEGGYSQKLDEFDQIFIELASKNWTIRGGDLFLENRSSSFLNFNKKVQGVSANFNFGNEDGKTSIFTSAALVKGQYAKSNFTGQEGNQGPYKLKGSNDALYVLVISGSERVFVNGVQLQRGENNDYTIDYNAGEITFTTIFPINSDMRITVEYQYSDRNYTRLLTYAGALHERKMWSLGAYVYSENDIKNQSLQQNLSEEQAQILAAAGDNQDLMTAPSAYIDTYSANKVLYEKKIIDGIQIFEYSNDETAELYNVRFLLVGPNQGNYKLESTAAISKIYSYVAPINGIKQGNYEPISRLIPPTKLQIATIQGRITPTEKTDIHFEMTGSNNDLNLFSRIDNNDNYDYATKINASHKFKVANQRATAFANYQYIGEDFRTVERLNTIEFDRDWNSFEAKGDQSLIVAGININFQNSDTLQLGSAEYKVEKLDYRETFSGVRHIGSVNLAVNNFRIKGDASFLKSNGEIQQSTFNRGWAVAKYHLNDKNWLGISGRFEDNLQTNKGSNTPLALSQKFTEYGALLGRGDSTAVYGEIGFLSRTTDSLQSQILQQVSRSNSFYLKSKLIQNEKTNLSAYINYRSLKYNNPLLKNEDALNSRIIYNDRFFDQFIQIATTYETSSGSIPQQEFTYLEVEAGQGVYVWNDYNANGIQELEEFEVAPFQDLAKFIRIFLPNQIYLKTHQNKFSQSVTLNPVQWQNSQGIKKILSMFYNQTSYIIDRKIKRKNTSFDLNPFSSDNEDLLGNNSNFRNSLYYNRGKQNHSVTWTVLNSNAKNLLSVGAVQNNNRSQQIQYTHLFKKYWLFNLGVQQNSASVTSDNFDQKNYEIKSEYFLPKISYIFSRNASLDVFYELRNKENQIGARETLKQNKLGTSFNYSSNQKFTMSGSYAFLSNDYNGEPNSAVGFQMLEGLQSGKNSVWQLLLQRNITQYLDVNVSYQGRKSETSKAIHTGSVQLRAFF
ncbi:MAG: hypothetical protein ACOH1O_12460 [Flavobacterium sp.]